MRQRADRGALWGKRDIAVHGLDTFGHGRIFKVMYIELSTCQDTGFLKCLEITTVVLYCSL